MADAGEDYFEVTQANDFPDEFALIGFRYAPDESHFFEVQVPDKYKERLVGDPAPDGGDARRRFFSEPIGMEVPYDTDDRGWRNEYRDLGPEQIEAANSLYNYFRGEYEPIPMGGAGQYSFRMRRYNAKDKPKPPPNAGDQPPNAGFKRGGVAKDVGFNVGKHNGFRR
jgi:hypothetical protein